MSVRDYWFPCRQIHAKIPLEGVTLIAVGTAAVPAVYKTVPAVKDHIIQTYALRGGRRQIINQ